MSYTAAGKVIIKKAGPSSKYPPAETLSEAERARLYAKLRSDNLELIQDNIALRQKYAKVRTEADLEIEHARAQAGKIANAEKDRIVAAERAHFQGLVDDKIAWIEAYAAECDQTVNVAMAQFEVVEAENQELRREIARLKGQLQAGPVSQPDEELKKKVKAGTPKARQLERQARQLDRMMRKESTYVE